MKIAIIGGSGSLGRGLAMRWARSSHSVIVGSRDSAKAAEVAAQMNTDAGVTSITGASNQDAASQADIVALTVPYANHSESLKQIASALDGKILIDVTVPLKPPKVRTVSLPEDGPVAKTSQTILGDNVRVVSAFQNVAAAHLADLDHAIDCDVLVCGNDVDARETVIGLANEIGIKAWHAGVIDNSVVAEALTSVLIFINGKYKIPGAGIQISGIPADLGDPQ
ncbi:NADPH-dependent F420 reductase [Hwanghaeella sp. LZ110]|uniref:NADPH-dependent F420 reductase n=1 Tax=Hwanghaeella sp. LZ110 TaxID=3402810 RepID=UPI003B670D76